MSFSDMGLIEPRRFSAKLEAARGLAITSRLTLAFLEGRLSANPTRRVEEAAGEFPEVTIQALGRP